MALLVTLLAPPVAGQAAVRGQVRRGVDTGSVPLAGQWVVLHRVDRASGAPVDSQRTTAAGRYRFPLDPDTAAIMFAGWK